MLVVDKLSLQCLPISIKTIAIIRGMLCAHALPFCYTNPPSTKIYPIKVFRRLIPQCNMCFAKIYLRTP
jgi:hypothetical protein